MKLKHIFSMALAALLAVGCSDENSVEPLDSIRLDQTFVAIDATGGDATVTVTAQADWQFDKLFMNVVRNDDGTRDTTYTALPSWLTATAEAGSAGQTTVTFHADATNGGREAELRISCGAGKQFVVVRQGSMEASEATCADVIAAPDGKTFRVKGVVTSIANTHYGNWHLADDTGTIYIYGTNDRDGKKGNDPIDGSAGWGFEVGDSITVEGPKSTYNGTVELVDVTVVNITKSLIKVVTPEPTVSKEGEAIDVKLAYKGSGAYATLPADCNWVSILGTDYVPGKATLFEPNPADTAVVHLSVQPNDGAARKAVLTFSSSNATNQSDIQWTISQEAFVLPHGETADDPFTIAEAIAKCQQIGSTSDGVIYYARGIISSIKEVSPSYGNATFNISDDGTDQYALTCYRSYSLDNQKFTSEDEIGVGDEVLMCGKLVNFTRDGESFTPEFSGNVYIVSRKSASEANLPGTRLNPFTPAQANAFVSTLEAGVPTEEDYYVAGEICKIKYTFSAQYGTATFFISEDGDPGSEQFQIYSCYYFGNQPWVDGNTQITEGDAVVVCGKLVNYNGNTPETASKQAYIYSLNGKKE